MNLIWLPYAKMWSIWAVEQFFMTQWLPKTWLRWCTRMQLKKTEKRCEKEEEEEQQQQQQRPWQQQGQGQGPQQQHNKTKRNQNFENDKAYHRRLSKFWKYWSSSIVIPFEISICTFFTGLFVFFPRHRTSETFSDKGGSNLCWAKIATRLVRRLPPFR